MKIALTDREADVMQVLWDHGPSVVAEVRARLRDELAYTTVLTILRTLETKGYVGHREEGRGYRYFPAVQRQAAQRSALRHLLGKLFQGSSEVLFARLVDAGELRPEQIRRMRRMLQAKSGQDDPDDEDKS
jgi:BlaI family transcriptional regulator, penicillinase repressor